MYVDTVPPKPLSASAAEVGAFGAAVGRVLGDIRRDRGRSGEWAARQAGVSVDAVRSLECGRTANPGFWTVMRLADALDASLDDIALAVSTTPPQQRQPTAASSESAEGGRR